MRFRFSFTRLIPRKVAVVAIALGFRWEIRRGFRGLRGLKRRISSVFGSESVESAADVFPMCGRDGSYVNCTHQLAYAVDVDGVRGDTLVFECSPNDQAIRNL